MSEVGQGVSVEIKVTPMQSTDYLSDIETAIECIEKSGLYYSVGPMSTVVSGPLQKVLDLIQTLYLVLDDRCTFALDVRLSNGCRI
jgi:uncharacterized protein YqgV (UPF0045/DUF77 family)